MRSDFPLNIKYNIMYLRVFNGHNTRSTKLDAVVVVAHSDKYWKYLNDQILSNYLNQFLWNLTTQSNQVLVTFPLATRQVSEKTEIEALDWTGAMQSLSTAGLSLLFLFSSSHSGLPSIPAAFPARVDLNRGGSEETVRSPGVL